MINIKQLIIEKTKVLEKYSVNSAKLEARILLAKVLKKDLNWTFLNLEKNISKKNFFLFNQLIKEKIKKKPTAYLVGFKEFWGLNFKVNKHTLIPRPETELIISVAKKKYNTNSSISVLDLGTGSGCILLSILKEFPKAVGIGTDKKINSIKVAKFNSKKLSLNKESFFCIQDWNLSKSFKKLLTLNKKKFKKNKFDLIVSNPPYISKSEINNLMKEVKYEPKIALNGGHKGIEAYKKIFFHIRSILSKNGSIIFEIDPKRAMDIEKILQKEGFKKIVFFNDLSNKRRVVFAKNNS